MQQVQVGIETAQGSMPRNIKNESRYVPSVTQWCRKGQKTWEPALHEKMIGTSGNLGRWTMKEGGRGTFQPDRKEFSHLEKMTKGKAAKKWVWKVASRSFGKRRIRSQPLGPPRRGRSARDFWRGTSKWDNSKEIRNGPATNVANTTSVLVFRVANGRNHWYTKKP